jgi:hypothetical protein
MVEPLFFASLAFLFFALLWSSLMVYLRTWHFWRFLPSTFLLYSTLPRSLPDKGLLVFVIVQTLSRVTTLINSSSILDVALSLHLNTAFDCHVYGHAI